MPRYMRMPKRGFNHKRFADVFSEVNVGSLNCFEDGTVVTAELLLEKRIIRKVNDAVAILGNGELPKNLTVEAAIFTKSAAAKIEAAGGKVQVL